MREAIVQRGWLSPEADQTMRDEVNREVEQATEAAEAAPEPEAGTLARHVYADA
jgi:TPP-dependent pyruvate/acetoin dehydrogenase alpha subunit